MGLISNIEEEFTKLSKGQKLIADFILKNYDKAAFMTAAALSREVGVSEATVVRFSYAMGYDGYPKLQKDLQVLIQNKLTTMQRINLMDGLSIDEIINASFKADISNLKNTKERLDPKVLESIIDVILNARNIYILGTRSSKPLAEFLNYYMSYILDNIKLLHFDGSDIFRQIMGADKQDILIAISFPRYSVNTMDGINYLKEKGCKVISITDSLKSPPAMLSDFVLPTRSYMNSFVDSFVAPLSAINLLIIMLGLRKKDELFHNFNILEEYWSAHKVYVTSEMEDNWNV